jgi:hypothetical protein
MRGFNCNGIWWLPESPSERIAGILRFSDDNGVVLSLMGTLGEPTANLEEKPVPIILGLVWDCPSGREVTLKNCSVKSLHLGSGVPAREDYMADSMFVGSHLGRQEDFSFSKLSIMLSGLPSWAAPLSGLSYHPLPADQDGRDGDEIRFLRPIPISGKIPGGEITLGVGATLSSTSRRDWSITEEVRFNITCEQPQSNEILRAKYVNPLQNLMTVATDQPNAVVEFSVQGPASRKGIQVLERRFFDDSEAAAGLFPHQMIFSLEDVGDRAIPLISRWIEISERLGDVCGPYFAMQYRPDSLVDIQFLMVFVSLEVYQRRREQAGAHAISSQSSLQGEHLARLLEEHAATVGPLFGGDTEEAVIELITYRNYIVHRDSDLGDRPSYSRDLFWLTQKLLFLMKACLLTELGLSIEDQSKFFRRNQIYIRILSLTKG